MNYLELRYFINYEVMIIFIESICEGTNLKFGLQKKLWLKYQDYSYFKKLEIKGEDGWIWLWQRIEKYLFNWIK